MKYININNVKAQIPAAVITALNRLHQRADAGDDQVKQDVIDAGNPTWRLTRQYLENASNRKCWYTESRNSGFIYDVDHFRPKGKVVDDEDLIIHWYWFLAFDPENYRLSCNLPNRLNVNPLLGMTGGKGSKFPLLGSQVHAATKAEIVAELPVLLDPCNEDDCNLVEFGIDGRPVISSSQRGNPEAIFRLVQSNLLLNLDYPTFNEDREKIYNDVRKLILRGDRYGIDNPALKDVQDDLRELMGGDMPYSKAAACYIRMFRNRTWVEDLFF